MIRNDQKLLHHVDRYMFASPRHCATNKVLRTILHLFGPATWHKVLNKSIEKNIVSPPWLTRPMSSQLQVVSRRQKRLDPVVPA